MKIQNLEFETNLVIMPSDTNYHFPLIFGGAFFSKMDLAAAACVSRALHDSECNSAVTYKVTNLTFHKPTYCGELIFIKCKIVGATHKSLTIDVRCYRERRAIAGQDFVAEGRFVFVTKLNDEFHPHGLTLE